jgi:hypothetical protein
VCGLHSNLIFSILPLAPPIDSELLAGLPQQQSKGPAAGCSCPPRQSVLVHVDSPASTCPGSRPRAASSSRLAPQTSCRLRGMAALRWALWRAAVHGLPLSQSQPEIEPPTTTGLRELLNLPSSSTCCVDLAAGWSLPHARGRGTGVKKKGEGGELSGGVFPSSCHVIS